MKWKTKENSTELFIDEGGNPVAIFDDGSEQVIKYSEIVLQKKELSDKLKAMGNAKDSLESLYATLGVSDLESAKAFAAKAKENAAIAESGDGKKVSETVSLLNAKIDTLNQTIASKDNAIAELNAKINRYAISTAFVKSKFIQDKIVNSTLAEKVFAENFKIEDGKIVGYDDNGNKILNDQGDPNFDVAIEKLVNGSSYKDSLLKSDAFSGGGASGSGGGGSIVLSDKTESELCALEASNPALSSAVQAELSKRISEQFKRKQ